MIDLFAAQIAADPIMPVRPRALDHTEWPPDYVGVYAWRMRQLAALRANPETLASAKAYYSTRPAEFIMHWMDTFDPRNTVVKWMPFVFFHRQLELVQFLHELRNTSESGLIEKCRDAGATWVSCGYSVWSLLFIPSDAIGWGSRKESLVDKLGDADSIFEKMRLILSRLPDVFLPRGWNARTCASYMKIINPENGANISGEAGDNIGRGGRKSAQPLDAIVMTPKGFRTMGEIETGDFVIGSNGKPVKVIATVEHGVRSVYKVSFNDGTSTECDGEHLWQVQDKATRKNLARSKKIRGADFNVIDTNEIAQNLFHSRDELNYTIPITEPVEFETVAEQPLHPYIVGVLLGDGCVRNMDRTTPTFVSLDSEIVQSVIERMPDYGRVSFTGDGKTYSLCDVVGRRGPGVKSRMKEVIRDIGIAEHTAHNKFIPDEYKFTSIENRIEILQGLMDTDGYVSVRKNAGKICISLASEKLIDDIRFIVESLGGTARKTRRKTKCADSITLTMNFPEWVKPFKIVRKLERVGARSKYKVSRAISNVQYVGEKRVKCITVENDDGLYLTNNAIVTHNCYYLDEAAHVARPELIEAALGDNTNVRVDISSVNGVGNVFHRRRESGVDWYPDANLPTGSTRVFVFDWRDHPAKTQEWYDRRKSKFVSEGMAHIFAQEVDRDYSASISNAIIPMDWINAAVDAHLTIPYLAAEPLPEVWGAGLDVADGGEDRNALTIRQSIIVRSVEEWGERDPGVTTRRTHAACRAHMPIKVQYDCIGVGSSVKSEYNRWVDEGLIDQRQIKFVPWSAGAKVINPYERVIPDDDLSPLNREMFGNFKAQAWWALRTRFYKTWRALTEGTAYSVDELISLDSSMPLLQQLKKELAQPTKGDSGSLQMIVNKTPNGMKSPNLADSVVQAMFPAPDEAGTVQVGRHG